MRTLLRVMMLAVFPLVAAGCVTARLEMGSFVPLERVDELTIGESTTADVERVLGVPDGRGEALLPIHTGPRTVWSYYYEFSDIDGMHVERWGRSFLWVYFDGDVYDGYMGFSSLPDDVRESERIRAAR